VKCRSPSKRERSWSPFQIFGRFIARRPEEPVLGKPDTQHRLFTAVRQVVKPPQPMPETPQRLCLDKAYVNPTGDDVVSKRGYVRYIRHISEERQDNRGQKTSYTPLK